MPFVSKSCPENLLNIFKQIEDLVKQIGWDTNIVIDFSKEDGCEINACVAMNNEYPMASLYSHNNYVMEIFEESPEEVRTEALRCIALYKDALRNAEEKLNALN